MGDPLDDLAAQQKADQLRTSVLQAQAVAPNPDQWVQHQQAAATLGVSPTLVATDPAFYHQAATNNAFDYATYAKTYPLLSRWASTPDNAAVAHDDLNHLSGIEQVGHQAKALLWDAPRALLSEAYSKLIHGTAETAGKGMVNLGGSSEPGGLVNRTLGTIGRSGQGIPALMALLAGQQLTVGAQGMQQSGVDVVAWNKDIQQTITGSYAPSWGGKAGGFVGDIAGTLARYGIANALLPGSSAAAMGLESGSNAYYDTGQQTDPATGLPYTATQKMAMGLIHGGVGFGLGFTHLVPGMGPSTGSALGVAAKELLVKAPITAAALTGSDLLSRAGVLGQDISADQVGHTFLQDYIQMAGFHGAGLIGQLSGMAQESKLRKRSAEKFQEATAAALDGSGIETLNIPADRLDTYFQSKKLDPTTEVARILGNGDVKAGLPDAQRVLTEARASGTDVQLPTAGFLAHLDPEHQKELLQDVRVQPGGPTAREYDTWVKEGGPDQLKAQTQEVDAETQASPEYVALKADLLARFSATDTPAVAESNATLMANVYTNLARESGQTSQELLAHYDPKVVLGPAPVDGPLEQGALYQGDGEREFGSKAWQEYYGLTKGAGRAAGDRELRAKDALRQSLTKKGGQAFDAEREAEFKAQEDAFAAFEASTDGVAQPRGWFSTLPDGTFEIGRTKIGDLSTFVHEPAHSYLKMIQDLVKREGASENLKADHAKILEFLGAKDGEDLTRDQNETWARANESYLREGKAPSPGLRGVFQRFAVWLGSIYRKASDLGVELDPEIRAVFDRLYAAEEGVNKAHEDLAGPRLFKTPEEAGWTPEQLQDYADSKDLELEQAKSEILGRLNEAALREKTTEWKADQRATREAVTELVDQRPEYRAIRALRRGTMDDGTELTLNREELVKQFGEDRVKEIQAKHPGLYRNEGGVDPETAAEILGFDSAEQMMQALQGADRRGAAIEEATRQAMTEKHGDIRYDGTIEDQARLAVNNEQHAANLMRELAALQKQVEKDRQSKQDAKAGVKAATTLPKLETFRDTARGLIEAKPIMDIQPNRYALGQQKYSREAFKAMGKSDYEGARDAKQKELTNHFLFLESLKAQVEVDKAFAYVKRFGKASIRDRIAKAGAEQGQHVYLDQIDQLLERFQFVNASNKAIQAGQVQSLEAWAGQQAANGEPIAIDPELYSMRPKNYRELNLGELRAVKDALANIDTLAKNDLGFIRDGKRVSIEAEADRFDQVARAANKTKLVPRGGTHYPTTEAAGRWIRGADSYMTKMEWLIDQIDGGDVNGPARANIKAPIDAAAARRNEMGEEIFGKLKEIVDARPKQDVRDSFESTGVTFPGMDRPLNRMQLVSWALNLGSEENRKVALQGEGLLGTDGMTIHPAFDQALGALRESEARFIQGTWDILNGMLPDIREEALRRTGIEPKWKKVTPFDIKTVDGATVHMTGGYYPLKPDPSIDATGRREVDPGLDARGFTRPSTSTSHTKEVSGATYRLMLDYQHVLSQHLADVINDTTTGAAISQVYKFLNYKSKVNADGTGAYRNVFETIQQTLGPKEADEFLPWLQDFANNKKGDSNEGGPILRSLMSRRSGMVLARLGANPMSLMIQTGDIFKAFADPDVKSSYIAKAFLDLRLNPKEIIEDIRQRSPNEMRHREENFNRDIRDMLQNKSIFDEHKAGVSEFLMQGFSVMDRFITFPVWLARYRQGLEAHGLPEQAAREADRVISRSFQAGENRNMSRMMREPGMMKLITTFQGDANTWYGLVASSVRSADPKRISIALMALIAEQVVTQAIRGRTPDKDENKAGWLAYQTLLAGVGKVPFFGDLTQMAVDKLAGQYTSGLQNPTMSSLEKTATAPYSVKQYVQDKEDFQTAAQDVVEAVGMWTGIPGTSQIVKSWKYIHHVQTGKDQGDNPLQITKGVLTGRAEKR